MGVTNTLPKNRIDTRTSPIASHLFSLPRSLRKLLAFLEVQWVLGTHGTDRLLQRRFNRWARRGRGESMERGHARIAETIWKRMELSATDRILDLGCGQGWACRVMAQRAPQGCLVMGIDISDEMIRRARENSPSLCNVTYQCGQAQHIPRPANYFTKIISIEAFYYFERQDEVLQELFRVMQAGGQLYLLLCLFRDDHKPKGWFEDVSLPVHNRSISEYEDMLRRTGWIDVISQVFDFGADAAEEGDDHDRPLLVTARKP